MSYRGLRERWQAPTWAWRVYCPVIMPVEGVTEAQTLSKEVPPCEEVDDFGTSKDDS